MSGDMGEYDYPSTQGRGALEMRPEQCPKCKHGSHLERICEGCGKPVARCSCEK